MPINSFDTASLDKQSEKKVEPVVECTKCKNNWFEQIHTAQFKRDHTVILGQAVPYSTDNIFVILRCIKCNELYAPNVLLNNLDSTTKAYNAMLDKLEEK